MLLWMVNSSDQDLFRLQKSLILEFETDTAVLLWNLSLWRIVVTWNLHSGYLKFELVNFQSVSNFSVNCRLWLLCLRLTGILYLILRSHQPYIVSVLILNNFPKWRVSSLLFHLLGLLSDDRSSLLGFSQLYGHVGLFVYFNLLGLLGFLMGCCNLLYFVQTKKVQILRRVSWLVPTNS